MCIITSRRLGLSGQIDTDSQANAFSPSGLFALILKGSNIKSLKYLALLPLFFSPATFSSQALDDCADQFIGGNSSNAPTIRNSPVDQPYGSNHHLCYQDDGVSFFATEYWPNEFAPRWAAYKLDPTNYGVNGCSTFTRETANCYISKDDWQNAANCEGASDPFHSDHMLSNPKLTRGNFSNTGHDRGHIAPRQAFSWNVCATYQTFSMANMSPQRAYLNQNIWMELEKQVLTWAIDEGPIYVVSGTTFNDFPYNIFQVYSDGILDADKIYGNPTTMTEAVNQHSTNFDTINSGDILKPKRKANPNNIQIKVADMRMPTGYFKVIYRPAVGAEPEHVIGFLLPHSYENLNMLSHSYNYLSKQQAFRAFISRIDVIEEASGIRFNGIPQSMKSTWSDSWFFDHLGSRGDLRDSSCSTGSPQGILASSTIQERLDACKDQLVAPTTN